jgi:hypothetical protein
MQMKVNEFRHDGVGQLLFYVVSAVTASGEECGKEVLIEGHTEVKDR